MTTTHFIILAAGKGTRMKSDLPKILHPVGNLAMIGHVVHAVHRTSLGPKAPKVHVVLGDQADRVQAFLSTLPYDVSIVMQDKQLGTAHAVQTVVDHARAGIKPQDHVIVLFGDTPLIQPETISMLDKELANKDMVVAGMTPPDAKQYGRLVVNNLDQLDRIVEFKHATDYEKTISLCNSGVMAFQAKTLQKVLPLIQPQAETGEYYLTDAIEALRSQGALIGVVEIDYREAEGVNTQYDLAQAEVCFQNVMQTKMLESGVSLQNPSSVHFSFDTVIEPGTFIEPNVYFGAGVTVAKGTHIRAFSHIEGASIGENSIVGPFARLRPGTQLDKNTKVGNFVELKNTCLGPFAKVNHLSYVGDTIVGENSNIGAGTITCNYDGFEKYKTIIGNNVFIGSQSCLVAPVKLGDGSMTAAGSTVTKDVEADALCVSRAPQKNLVGKAKAFRVKKQSQKNNQGQLMPCVQGN